MSLDPPPPDYRAELARSAASTPLRNWIVSFVVVTALLTLAAGVVGHMQRGDAPAPIPGAPIGPIKGAPAG